jgi:alkylated DNA repair dioxygenase AlkB
MNILPESNLLPFDGTAYLLQDTFTTEESNRYLSALQYDNKTYRYSGLTMKPLPWTDTLLQIKERVEHASSYRFNSVLLNFYRDGQDSMGWHRDNEKELGENPVIASVSFGAERKFQFRHYKDQKTIISLVLNHGSLLLMSGATQSCWQHRLPKSSIMQTPRINLTFRNIIS